MGQGPTSRPSKQQPRSLWLLPSQHGGTQRGPVGVQPSPHQQEVPSAALPAEYGRRKVRVFLVWTYVQVWTCSLEVSFFFLLSVGHLKCANHRTVCPQTCITDALHWRGRLQSPQIPSPMPGRGLCPTTGARGHMPKAPMPVMLVDL